MTDLLKSLSTSGEFIRRHNGPREHDETHMLDVINASSIDALIDETVPAAIRLDSALECGPALSEATLTGKTQ